MHLFTCLKKLFGCTCELAQKNTSTWRDFKIQQVDQKQIGMAMPPHQNKKSLKETQTIKAY